MIYKRNLCKNHSNYKNDLNSMIFVKKNANYSNKHHGKIDVLIERETQQKKSSKVVYLELSRWYLQSITKITIITILKKIQME